MLNINKVAILFAFGFLGCSSNDQDNASEAQRRGVGAECKQTTDCLTEGTVCLTQFRGGYCGLAACQSDTECPSGSACVAHDDGTNYCFLICAEKLECNIGRSTLNESNCVANITFVSGTKNTKACVPPNGG